VGCLDTYQNPRSGVTHVAAITHNEAEITRLHYFVLPNDITSSKLSVFVVFVVLSRSEVFLSVLTPFVWRPDGHLICNKNPTNQTIFFEDWTNETNEQILLWGSDKTLAGHVPNPSTHRHSKIAMQWTLACHGDTQQRFAKQDVEKNVSSRPRTTQHNNVERGEDTAIWQIILVKSCCLMCLDAQEDLSLIKKVK